MAIRQVSYLGILTNVDASILKVRLDNGFRIESMSLEALAGVVGELDGVDGQAVVSDWMKHQTFVLPRSNGPPRTLDQIPAYVVTKTVEADLTFNAAGRLVNWMPPELADIVTTVQDYLDPTIELIRLYKEGNIRKHSDHCYTMLNGKRTPLFSKSSAWYVEEECFSLRDEDIPGLESFIRTVRLPLPQEYVDLAYRQWELSYRIPVVGLAFLSLMIAMEVLFESGAHKVARNAAVLLGRDQQESSRIFDKVRKLHEIRSQFVHSGKAEKVGQEDVKQLRLYVRECIKRANGLNLPRNQLLSKLNSLGFGGGLTLG